MSFVLQLLLVCLWYFTDFGIYLVLPLKILGVLMALGGRSRARKLIQFDMRIRQELSGPEYIYLIQHAQFFIYPMASHMTARMQMLGFFMFAVLCVRLGIDGQIVELVLAAPFCLFGYYIGGNWNHPFLAAGRAQMALVNGQDSAELIEKQMYDRIIIVLDEIRSRD